MPVKTKRPSTLSPDEKFSIGDQFVTVRNGKIEVTISRAEWDRRVSESDPMTARSDIISLAYYRLSVEKQIENFTINDGAEDDYLRRIIAQKEHMVKQYPEEFLGDFPDGTYDPKRLTTFSFDQKKRMDSHLGYQGIWSRLDRGIDLTEEQMRRLKECQDEGERIVKFWQEMRTPNEKLPGGEDWRIRQREQGDDLPESD